MTEATISGTSGNDYFHPFDDGGLLPGPGYIDFPFTRLDPLIYDTHNIIDVSQGGDDVVVIGNAALYRYNTVSFGSTLTAADMVFGDGDTTVELAGNYTDHAVGRFGFVFDALTLGPQTLNYVGSLQLDEGSGFAYDITFNGLSEVSTVDASKLVTASVRVDASAVSTAVVFFVGSGTGTLIGGSGNDTFAFAAGSPNAAMHITGSGGFDMAQFFGTLPQPLTLSGANFDGIEKFRFDTGACTVATTDDLVGVGGQMVIFSEMTGALSFDGSAETNGSFIVTGSYNYNDTLIGGLGNDTLNGQRGDDILNGGGGADSLIGGIGDDTYVVDNVGDVVVENAGEGTDTVRTALVSLTLALNVETLIFTGSGNFAGTGNGLNNTVTGGTGNDKLDGGVGADGLAGGAGDDTYVIDDVGDQVTENAGAGSDTVLTTLPTYTLGANLENLTYIGLGGFSGIGNGLNNLITGGAGSDVLSGGTGKDTLVGGEGADIMIGGSGNDRYSVDDARDIVVENAGTSQGIDTVMTALANYALGANVEKLVFTGSGNFKGTGNGLNNTLTGNAGTNHLYGGDGNDSLYGGAGTDTLNGGLGVDSLIGGADNDYYFVDNAADVIVETAGGGTLDRVFSSVSYTLSASADIEYLATTAAAGIDSINLTGNALAQQIFGNAGANALNGGDGNDTITGGAGTDTLNGGTGADSLIGGADNDWYYVDSGADIVIELAGGGVLDRVLAAASYTLAAAAAIEYLATTSVAGLAAITLGGNALSQTIIGNNGADALYGGLGNDTLTGNLGADQFVFNTTFGATNVDRVLDFSKADGDTIVLENGIFAGIAGPGLAPAQFEANLTGVATVATTHIIYKTDTGKLYYDADGLGGTAGVLFAQLAANIVGFGAGDFSII